MEGLPYPVFVRNRGWLEGLDQLSEHVPELPAYLRKVSGERGQLAVASSLINVFRATTDSDKEVIAAASHILSVIRDYRERHGAVIEVTDALETMLLSSDIDDSLPMGLLALPYPTQYVCFGHAARAKLRLGTGDLADYEPHGCFCVLSACQAGVGQALTIYIVMVTPDGRNKTITFMHSPIRDPEAPLQKWVSEVAATHADGPAALQDSLRLVSYLAKVFLYLGMKEGRSNLVNEHTELAARLERVEPKKRGKLERRLQRLYDRIVVGPDSLPQELGKGLGVAGTEIHWRRGHFRMQPHGPRNSLRKVKYLQPMLVNAKTTSTQDMPVPKTYSLKR